MWVVQLDELISFKDGLLAIYTVYFIGGFATFRWNMLPPFSGWLSLVHINAKVVGRRKYMDYEM